MAKPEWGTKRTCPKCGTRFYDLGNDEPVVCIECGEEWIPEPILKSKQPIVEVEADKSDEKSDDDDLLAVVDGDDDDVIADDDGDDTLIADVSLDDDDDAEVSGMVDNKLASDE